ncbi:MAG: FAD:protein FMN transferase [Bacillota bacterium]|nr:FAD:protein FMN transferase [Bacillota bacterium]
MGLFHGKLIADYNIGAMKVRLPHWPRRLIIAIVLAHFLLAALVIQMLRSDRLPGGPGKIERTEFLMDTIVKAEIFTDDKQQAGDALTAVFSEVAALESVLDRHVDGSDVSRINQAAGETPVAVSDVTLSVVRLALEIGRLTEGAFDITIAPLIELWGFGTGDVAVPTEEQRLEALELVDYTRVQLEGENRIFLPDPEMQLDLGGIAKGFIVDRAVEFLLDAGVTSANFNAGGDIRVIGDKPDGSAWRIGITHPRPRDSRDLIAIVEIRDKAIVTSGDYERYFLADGIRYHHILDPETGLPAQGLTSVTIVADDAHTADALSTAVFVMGTAQGMELIESLPEVEAILITEDETLHISTGLQGKVEILE